MTIQDSNPPEPATLALSALAWVLAEPARAERLLGTTGLTPDRLRDGIGEPGILAAIITFLEAHEPDLIACAEALSVSPALLVSARTSLEIRP
jgi:Protein of unknown function (DUF3572)